MPHKDTANEDAGCLGTTACFALGVFFSAFALVIGITIATSGAGGHDTSGRMVFISPFLIALIAWPIGGIVAVAVLLGCVVVRCRHEVMNIALLALPSLILFVGSICWAAHYQHSESDRFKHDMEAGAESGRIYRRLYLQVKENPEIALRDKWYSFSDDRRRVYQDSIRDPTIPYSLALLKRFYLEAPATRTEIFANPACDAAFLSEHFDEAWNLALARHDRMLDSIVKNAHTPRELIEKVAQAEDLSMEGVAAGARYRLKTIDLGRPLSPMETADALKAPVKVNPAAR
jgi:hypothetical protein